MDDPFAASLLVDPDAIYTPSPITQASPFRASTVTLPGHTLLEDEGPDDIPSYAGALSSTDHNLAFPTLFHRNNEREEIIRDVNNMAKHLLQCHSCHANEGASKSQNEGASKSQHEGASKSQNEGACASEDTVIAQLLDIDRLSSDAATPQRQLLYWHHRLNHQSFSSLKSMANEGKLPRNLASVEHPGCAACEMATAHRKPWRNRRAPSGLRKAKRPGQCISIDQLKSPIPGLMGQIKGIPTTKRFNYATVFVDHYSDIYIAEPRQSHAEAVKRIGRYLLGTRGKGIVITPDISKGLECYVDSDSCGNWDPNIAEHEPITSKSRYGYILKLHGMPVYWASKLHTIITLSTAESEYIALSNAARYVRGTVYLLQEINDMYHQLHPTPQVTCRLFEDNSAAYEMAKVPKMRPRTRHINVAYHHFRGEVANGCLIPCECATQDMEADIFTKATSKETLITLRKRIMGW
ncbi:GAG-pre-integrase domain containing protein [Nitzschia inconspicua]|uniref:GAG-pre-integrase domain containing protein n=1 Tax=Nitzschia inconspicua TaxID=303405 RepID=A0A9K3PIP1_9STRA|nr:GAG-pre-integrase domain containing protein [Nitzschia inconspicua]